MFKTGQNAEKALALHSLISQSIMTATLAQTDSTIPLFHVADSLTSWSLWKDCSAIETGYVAANE